MASSSQPREGTERPRDSGRDRGRDRLGRDSGRDRANPPYERGDRHNRSRSPRERGGRRADNRYRSRSPFRGGERDRDGGRERDRDGGRAGRGDRNEREDRNRNQFRGREPPRGPRGGGGYRRGDSRPGGPVRAPEQPKTEAKEEAKAKVIKHIERPEGIDDDTWELMKTMGFTGFKSTKETKVPGNDQNYGIRKEKELKARQYMNRQGGFNRPLSPSR